MAVDLHGLAIAFAPVTKRAAQLPWAKQRPWRPETHVSRRSANIVEIDCHDLSVRLALDLLDIIENIGPKNNIAAAVFITGRGRHTGGRSVLRDAVWKQLATCADRNGWLARPEGPARFRLILDATRAHEGMGALFWGFVLLVLGAIAVVLFNP